MTHAREKQSDDKLAAILREFGDTVAHESQLSADERKRLVDTIVETLEDTCEPSLPPRAVLPNVEAPGKNRRFPAVFAAGVVLMFAFAAILYWRQLPDNRSAVPMTHPVVDFAAAYQDQIQIALEHEAVMGQPLAWFFEQDNDVQFAMLPGDAAASPPGVVFAELTVVKSPADISQPATSRTSFIMLREAQPLELFHEEESSPRLLFWLYPVEKNLFAYELSLDGNDDMELAADTAGLIEPKTMIQPLDIKKEHAEYRVFLQIHPI